MIDWNKLNEDMRQRIANPPPKYTCKYCGDIQDEDRMKPKCRCCGCLHGDTQPDWSRTITELCDVEEGLTDWEIKFINSMVSWREQWKKQGYGQPSPAQLASLNEIAEKRT